jgi:hypothetical protein
VERIRITNEMVEQHRRSDSRIEALETVVTHLLSLLRPKMQKDEYLHLINLLWPKEEMEQVDE